MYVCVTFQKWFEIVGVVCVMQKNPQYSVKLINRGGLYPDVALILTQPTEANQNLSLYMPQSYEIIT